MSLWFDLVHQTAPPRERVESGGKARSTVYNMACDISCTLQCKLYMYLCGRVGSNCSLQLANLIFNLCKV